MLAGNLWLSLGRRSDLLDIIGVNYYPYNQRYLHSNKVLHTHPEYKSLANLLNTISRRYQRPLFIAETGAEGIERQKWRSYICDEVLNVSQQGIKIEGICLYHITDYFGWTMNAIVKLDCWG